MSKQGQNQKHPTLHAQIPVVGADGQKVGLVLEVFRGIGEIETFGAVGIPPQQEGHDPVRYAYSEGMPGSGEDFFAVRPNAGEVLYIPLSAVESADQGRAVLSVDAESVDLMNWTVRPDALTSIAHEYPSDEGAEPNVA